KYPTAEEFTQAQMFNPDETAARGLWTNPSFLEHVSELNPQARHTQFADFHGHGWIFRAVYKKDRKGNLLDDKGHVIEPVTTDKRASLRTTGPAAYTSSPQWGRNLETLRTPYGKRRFERRGNTIVQNSMVEKDLAWEVVQVIDTITPGSKHYSEKAALAKTV